MIRLLSFMVFMLAPLPAPAQESPTGEPPMTLSRMAEIVYALDAQATPTGSGFTLSIADVPVLIITDLRADRMRAMVPIRAADGMTLQELQRVMQANFDSALDARYAIAQGRLWAVFIHPLRALERDQLISGLGQTVNIARSYGTLYSGGAAQFGGGDSADLQRQLIEELLDRGQDI